MFYMTGVQSSVHDESAMVYVTDFFVFFVVEKMVLHNIY